MYSRSYLVFWAVLNLFTFSVMLAVYTRIFVYVRHKSQQMSQHTSQMRHRETVFNLMKTVSMILGCFVMCWTPALVVLLLDGLGCERCKVLRYEKLLPGSGRVQLLRQPHHLLLQGQGHEEDLQGDPVLPVPQTRRRQDPLLGGAL
ncbi:hypothetical protein KUCAC02_034366 [Chaenocephalus aceratus]|nr:hypothetical protein KUCAC02_034366 [Chaenocephalus aceratus]